MPFFRTDRDGDTIVLTIDRPPANAIHLEAAAEFDARLAEIEAAPPRGGLVLTGAGRAFSGGVDFKAVPGYGPEEQRRMVRHIDAGMTRLYGLPTATVAAVNGHAIGGAFVLVLACDARLAAGAEAKLGLTEVTAGIPYPACPMEVVKAEIEPSFRRHLVLSGELITPAAAHAHGLVDALLPAGDLLAAAVTLARTRAAARSYARVKAQLRGPALERMREIVATDADPMLTTWV